MEYEIDQALGITSPQQVMEMGIAAYDGHCHSIVSRYCNEWERVVSRLGRWIDFRNDYKVMRLGGVRRYDAPHAAPHNCPGTTVACVPACVHQMMEPWYMESVWWVFKTLFEKGLVYRGFKVRASAHRACCGGSGVA